MRPLWPLVCGGITSAKAPADGVFKGTFPVFFPWPTALNPFQLY